MQRPSRVDTEKIIDPLHQGHGESWRIRYLSLTHDSNSRNANFAVFVHFANSLRDVMLAVAPCGVGAVPEVTSRNANFAVFVHFANSLRDVMLAVASCGVGAVPEVTSRNADFAVFVHFANSLRDVMLAVASCGVGAKVIPQ